MPTGTRPQFPESVARVALQGNMNGHPWVNILYLRLTHSAPVTINDLETITNAMADNWGTDIAPNLGNTTQLSSVHAVYRIPGGGSLDYVHTESKTGGGANPLPDAGSCIVVDWGIASYYRGGHPRSYVPGLQTTQIANSNIISSGNQATLATAFQNWLNHVNAVTSTNVTLVELGTVRYQSNKAWLSPPVFYPYLSVKIRAVLGSQRRRLLH